MNTSNDLSHIYHRPGELFWLECDPFQKAVPCWQVRELAMEPLLLYCPECQEVTVTVPAEGVPNQSLRGCLKCDGVFVKDWDVFVEGESA